MEGASKPRFAFRFVMVLVSGELRYEVESVSAPCGTLFRNALREVLCEVQKAPRQASDFGVRGEKAALSSGCKAHPATAPAGSNRSSYGGDEIAEAFGMRVTNW
jgi:hypothetical protein